VHVTGESLNPSHGIEVNGVGLILCPLIAGQAGGEGAGICGHGGRHAARMPGAECGAPGDAGARRGGAHLG